MVCAAMLQSSSSVALSVVTGIVQCHFQTFRSSAQSVVDAMKLCTPKQTVDRVLMTALRGYLFYGNASTHDSQISFPL